MYIDYKNQKYGLCFENDYLDILCFELGYEFSNADLQIKLEMINGEPVLDANSNPIPIMDNSFLKKLRDILYSLLKASFCQKLENKGTDFPISLANVTAIMMKLIMDGRLVEVINNMNDANKAFLPETKSKIVSTKKKLVGTK